MSTRLDLALRAAGITPSEKAPTLSTSQTVQNYCHPSATISEISPNVWRCDRCAGRVVRGASNTARVAR